MSIDLPFSAPCERNKNDILKTITPYLKSVNTALEIGTGSAQHAVYFAQKHPHLIWQTSDQDSYLEGIRAQLNHAQLPNLPAPVLLDVNQQDWMDDDSLFATVYTANTLHIMDPKSVQGFFLGLPKVTNADAYLIIYGPFKYQGKFTSESNQLFDETLRASDWGYAIPDFEAVAELAGAVGFNLLDDVAMPANNQLFCNRMQMFSYRNFPCLYVER